MPLEMNIMKNNACDISRCTTGCPCASVLVETSVGPGVTGALANAEAPSVHFEHPIEHHSVSIT